MSEKFLLKDHLFNKTSVTHLADLFYAQDKKFPRELFIKNCLKQFPDLELKQRITCMRREFESVLSNDYEKAVKSILQALPGKLDPHKTDDDFGEFIIAPLAEYIETNGCTEKHLELSLHALYEITMRFTVEASIRKFINNFPKETLSFLKNCSGDTNYHVRRLASEGLRPNLPWSQKINIHHNDGLDILDNLFYDKTRYVTRSVANHLNDISKIDAEKVIETLQKWELSQRQNKKEMDYIIQHSLRTLLKQGNKKAFQMLGYKKPADVSVVCKKISKQVTIGESLFFDVEIVSHREQKLMISYYVYFLNKKNHLVPKIFQIKKMVADKDEILMLSKKHLLRIMTTKKLYTGKHAIQIIVNGLPVTDKIFFTLTN